MTVQDLLGPGAALALALVMLGLFYTGRILPRNTVPREDYEAAQALVANFAAEAVSTGRICSGIPSLPPSGGFSIIGGVCP